jgi:UDP-N-acetylglucosamine acyltransferase
MDAYLSNEIHATAIIHPSVKIGTGNKIGPFCILGKNLTLGNRNTFVSHVYIGSNPEHVTYSASDTLVDPAIIVGDDNVFNPFVSVQVGIHKTTQMGNKNFLMAHTTFGHGTRLDNFITVSSGSTIAGESWIMEGATVGMNSSIHQNTKIGHYSMIGMNSIVKSDVKPFSLVHGAFARTLGINQTGIERNNFDVNSAKVITKILSEVDMDLESVMDKRIKEIFSEFKSRKNA